jgi:hypothetical protein
LVTNIRQRSHRIEASEPVMLSPLTCSAIGRLYERLRRE